MAIKHNVTIKKVETEQEMDDFVGLPHRLYSDTPQYVPDLDQDIRDTFNPKENPGLEYSDIQGFVAYDGEGQCVGRIAGIINRRANEKWNIRSVRFGFIDFIDDEAVSAALLAAVEEWGRERGMNLVQGPLGISDFDKEGMLVEDFDQMGSIVTIYNHPYYPHHMEALGFRKAVDWVQIQVDIPQEIPPKYARVTKLSREMFGLHVKKLSKRQIMYGGYGKRIFDLLNVCYSPLFGYSSFTDKQIDFFVKHYIPLIDTRMISVIEDGEGKMVGAGVSMGSLSHAMRKTHGKLLPWGWLHLLKTLKWKHEGKAEMLLIGVLPDYQGLGVNALFFNDLIPVFNKLGYTWAETGPQLEDNVRELSQWKPLNPRLVKRRRCYEKSMRSEEKEAGKEA